VATYYVRKSGNDGTGTGSTVAPWLTLNKAQTMMSAGDTCLIGDGTYNEDMGPGYCRFNKSGLTWQGENGASSAVVITSSTSATTNTLLVNLTSQTFKYLTFVNRLVGAPYAVRCTSNLVATFDGCHFNQSGTDGNTQTYGALFDPDTGFAQTITLENCTATPLDNRFIGLSFQATGTGVLTATLTDCDLDGGLNALACNGVNLVTVTGGTYTSQFSSAIRVGIDSYTGGSPSTVTLTGCTVDMTGATGGHAVMIGHGALNCVVDGVTIQNTYDYGLVIKEHGAAGGTEVKNCTIYGGTLAPIFCKGSTHANIHDNTLIAAAFVAFTADAGDTGHKTGDISLTGNTLIVSGAADVFYWPAAGDDGGAVCDYNLYNIEAQTTGDFGTIPPGAAGATVLTLRAAWNGYETGTNDDHSAYGVTFVAADVGDTFKARRNRAFEVA